MDAKAALWARLSWWTKVKSPSLNRMHGTGTYCGSIVVGYYIVLIPSIVNTPGHNNKSNALCCEMYMDAENLESLVHITKLCMTMELV